MYRAGYFRIGFECISESCVVEMYSASSHIGFVSGFKVTEISRREIFSVAISYGAKRRIKQDDDHLQRIFHYFQYSGLDAGL